MTGDERMARLGVEVRGELDRLDGVVRDLAECLPKLTAEASQVVRMGAAGNLHAYYTGCEAVLTRIARVVGDMPTGADWHRQLLYGATAPREGLRAPVLRPETAAALDRLLRFRHFFRVSYGVELEVDQLQQHAAAVPAIHLAFRADVEQLLTGADPTSGGSGTA